MTPAGWIPLRRGLLEHCRQGKLSPNDLAVFVTLLLSADSNSGVVWTSAAALSVNYGFGERAARSSLESLEGAGYIRRFPIPGRHGNYPILIDKFLATQGARRGQRLNAAKSASWKELVFDSCEESVEESVKESVEESARIAPLIKNENQNQNEIEKENEQSSAPARSWTGLDDDVLSHLRQELQKTQTTPLDDSILAFAVERITARASKPPSSFRFFLKAIPNFLSALEREVAEYLAEQAAPLVSAGNGGQGLSDGDLRELLKLTAARKHLPYDSGVITLALDIALRRRQKAPENRK